MPEILFPPPEVSAGVSHTVVFLEENPEPVIVTMTVVLLGPDDGEMEKMAGVAATGIPATTRNTATRKSIRSSTLQSGFLRLREDGG